MRNIKSWCSNNKIFGGDYEMLTLRLNGYFLITLATFSPFLECIAARKLLDRQQRDSDHRWPCVGGFSLQLPSVYLCVRLLWNSRWDIIQQCAASLVSVLTCTLQAGVLLWICFARHQSSTFCRRILTLLHRKWQKKATTKSNFKFSHNVNLHWCFNLIKDLNAFSSDWPAEWEKKNNTNTAIRQASLAQISEQ